MISPDLALEMILDNIEALPPEDISLEESPGRIIASDIYATEDLPPFHNSAMDGFAVRAADTAGASRESPVRLDIQGVVRAGDMAITELAGGMAIKIMTGSPLPAGADSVVIREVTRSKGDEWVDIFRTSREGDNIRGKGEDVHSGDLLLDAGTRIRPYELAVLAAEGIAGVSVVGKPRVALLATGDELVDFRRRLTPGKIRNSNGPALVSALARWGVEVLDLGIGCDDPEEMKTTLGRALPKLDMLIISGGVSVGDFDYTRVVLEELGFEEVFWRVAIKPGKPLLFGLFPGNEGSDKPVFGLPGNPVSVMICVEEFVRPAIEKLRGYRPEHPAYHLSGIVENDYVTPEERQQYLFCRVSRDGDDYRIHIIRPQGSAMMGMACKANGLAVSPIGTRTLKPGDVLPFRWLK